MPWPATHIIFAEEYLKAQHSQLDRKNFLIGTSFPDIRYPAKVERDQTHIDQPTIEKIRSVDAFRGGILFHNLIDILWNEEFHQHAYFITQIPHNPAMMHTLKILQDVFVYSRLDNWTEISASFETIVPEEYNYGVPKSMVRRWHKVLSQYLKKPPQFVDINMLDMSLPTEMVEKIKLYYQAYHSDPNLSGALIHLFDDIQLRLKGLIKDQS